jgi:hypothetical protein
LRHQRLRIVLDYSLLSALQLHVGQFAALRFLHSVIANNSVDSLYPGKVQFVIDLRAVGTKDTLKPNPAVKCQPVGHFVQYARRSTLCGTSALLRGHYPILGSSLNEMKSCDLPVLGLSAFELYLFPMQMPLVGELV